MQSVLYAGMLSRVRVPRATTPRALMLSTARPNSGSSSIATGWSRYRTPIEGLYLCGSGTHPGGGIPGAAGRNAAREML